MSNPSDEVTISVTDTPDIVTITPTETVETVVITVSDTQQIVDIDIIETPESVEIDITDQPQVVTVDISSVGEKGDRGPIGYSGTIDSLTLTPFTGILKGNGTTVEQAVGNIDYQSVLGYIPVNQAGDTMTGDLIGKDFVKTRNATPTYDINGRIISLAKTGGLTYTFTYNGDGTFHTKSDGTRTWTYSYSAGLWTGTVVT